MTSPINHTTSHTAAQSSATASAAPLRWLILGLLFCISVVTFIDRVNISR